MNKWIAIPLGVIIIGVVIYIDFYRHTERQPTSQPTEEEQETAKVKSAPTATPDGDIPLTAIVGTSLFADQNDPESSSPVDWSLASGGGIESLYHQHSYYVLIKLDDSHAQDGVVVHFSSSNGSILQVKDVRTSSSPFVHIDMDGYGEYLWQGQTRAEAQALRLFVSLIGDGEQKDFVSQLPSFQSLSSTGKQPIVFAKAATIPDVSNIRPVQVSEWPQVPGPPAVMRQQGTETALYFYYKSPAKTAAEPATSSRSTEASLPPASPQSTEASSPSLATDAMGESSVAPISELRAL